MVRSTSVRRTSIWRGRARYAGGQRRGKHGQRGDRSWQADRPPRRLGAHPRQRSLASCPFSTCRCRSSGYVPSSWGPLREQWRTSYPVVREQPPLPPTIETPVTGPPVAQFVVGPALQARIWFLSEDQSSLVQLQHDRLTVNWRQIAGAAYPRYPTVRAAFEERSQDLAHFVADRELGQLSTTQAEVTYINAIEAAPEQMGDLARVLRHWRAPTIRLGQPEQARTVVVFNVPDIGRPPVRMYATVDPARRPDGRPALFLTLTLRGAPAGDDRRGALEFMDRAHAHVVRSFAELTPETMHAEWGRRR